jgi:twitching motility two-component system response regulator PilH
MPNSRVLVIEDSRILRLATERVLTRAGHEVALAIDGEEGLRAAKASRPDVIVLDMLLPKISGPDVLRALKENAETSGIPVIVLSSLSQRNEQKLLRDGAAAYFEKEKLDLDKDAGRFTATVENVLCQARRQ